MFDRIEKNIFKLYEGLDDSWTNGEHTVTLRQLLIITKDIPVTEFPTEKLKDISLHANNPDEQDRIDKSDLQYPVLIFINGDNTIKYIVDGHHRIQKAIKTKLPTNKTKLIPFDDLPDDYKKVLG
jgi:hypothetical protein